MFVNKFTKPQKRSDLIMLLIVEVEGYDKIKTYYVLLLFVYLVSSHPAVLLSLKEGKQPVTDSDPDLQVLCETLECILRKGLKSKSDIYQQAQSTSNNFNLRLLQFLS